MSDNEKEPKLIFKAELVKDGDKLQIRYEMPCVHPPTLAEVHSHLGYRLNMLRARLEVAKDSSLIKPHSGMGALRSFLRRK